MSIAQIIADASANHEKGGIIDRHAAINEAFPLIMSDPDAVETIVRNDISKRIKQHLCKARDGVIAAIGSRQSSFFELHPAHVVDGSDGIIKTTRSMSRLEFHGLIKVRERQVADDTSYLARLKDAAAATALIWDAHPKWSWGQIEDAYTRVKKAA